MRGRRLTAAGAACLGLLVLATLLGVRWGDPSLYPAKTEPGIPVFLVSNGYHSGLILPRPDLARMAGRGDAAAVLSVATRFAHYDWIEAGWGEDRFYRAVPNAASMDWSLAVRALFKPGNLSVLHVVGIEGDPRGPFRGADLVALHLSEAGFLRLVSLLDASFARDAGGLPQDLGPGLYGPSLFYRATGAFWLANLCNHWTARLLDAAGVPVAPLLATLPRGLVLDLEWRSHLRREPDTLPVSAGTQ